METPKPKPPVQPLSAKTNNSSKTAKKARVPQQAKQVEAANKKFKLKPHLTQRPFSDDALFAKLREQAQPETMRPAGEAKKEGRK